MRHHGFDMVRGVSIILIMASHLWPFALVEGPASAVIFDTLAQLWRMYLMPIAVPAFMLVSLILFFRRPALSRRLRRLVPVFAVWLSVQYVLYAVVFRAWPPLGWHVFRIGGPSLSGYSTPTVLWFLYDLIILLSLADLYRRLKVWRPALGTYVDLLIVGVWALFALYFELSGVIIDHWLLGNVVVYIPIAWYMCSRNVRWKGVALLYLAATVAEMLIPVLVRPDGAILAVSGYARLAIPLGAVALVAWGDVAPETRSLTWLGRHSLGLFAVHNSLWWLFKHVLPSTELTALGGSWVFEGPALAAALVATFSLVWFGSRGPLRWLFV